MANDMPNNGVPGTVPGDNSTPQLPASVTNPPAPAPTLAPPTTTNAVANPQPQPPAPQKSRLHPLAGALDAVLKAGTGGDVYYTDPQGNRRLAPQSRGTLGKTLIAATLAGVLAKDEYRQTPYGPVRDFTGSAGNAMAATKNTVEQMRNRPQQLSDEAQAKKLMTIQNNANLIALKSASARLKHQNKVDTEQDVQTQLSPFLEYQQHKGANDPNAFLGQKQTADQVLKGGHKLSDSNIIQDGWQSTWNEDDQQMEDEPTYAVINPALKDIQLPKEVTDTLAKVNSQWKDIHAVVGGSVRVPVNAYVSALRDYEAVTQAQQTMELLQRELNPDGEPLAKDAVANLARKSKDSGTDMLPALYRLTHAVAGNNLPDKRPDNLLDTILKSDNGEQLLGLLGMTPEVAAKRAEKISNERTAAEQLAKLGGAGPKVPVPQDQVDKLTDTIDKDPDLTDNDRALLHAKMPEASADGVIHMNRGEVDNMVKLMNSMKNSNVSTKLRAGDPVQMQTTAENMIQGDLTNVKDIYNARSEVRAKFNNMLQAEARKRNLDPTRYTVEAQMAKANMYSDYADGLKGKAGAQIVSFNTLMEHVNEAYDANEAWVRSNNPQVAKAQAWWAQNMSNDPDYTRFQDNIIAPTKEYISFLKSNHAEMTEDIAALERVIDPQASPIKATVALQTYLKTADDRAAALARSYITTVGNTYPVVSPEGAAVLNRVLGPGKSKAIALSTPIPRGWQNGQATSPSVDVQKQIFAAAGYDPKTAIMLTKENGWTVPPRTDGK